MPKVKKTITETLKKKKVQIKKGPVWEGPCGEGEQGGITFSLLSRFLVCRERFRLYVVDGLKVADEFNVRMGYGNIWHEAEASFALAMNWKAAITEYCARLCKQYPLQAQEIDKWYNVCKVQFPVYIEYWKKHKDQKKRVEITSELPFDVPYPLPSGRVVRLRGKFDSLYSLNKKLGLQENKTKGDIDEFAIPRQLNFDLQTMIYAIAAEIVRDTGVGKWTWGEFDEVLYNVIRRPLSGGRHTIRQHQATSKKAEESPQEFYQRLQGLIEGEPEFFFMRWNVKITQQDIDRFKRECLDPILEQLCDWWDWITDPKNNWAGNKDPFSREIGETGVDVTGIHFRFPHGVWNPLLEGRSSDLDNYLMDGVATGLQRTDNLFTELTVDE